FLAGSKLIGRYHIDRDGAKPYFWPLHGPSGVILTRGWPMEKAPKGGSTDHPHQKSVWFCHGDVIPEGIELKQRIRGVEGVDFWSESKGHGQIVCTRHAIGTTTKLNSPPLAGAWHEWQTADGTKIMDDMRAIHFHNFGDTRLFVFNIDLHASVCSITFGDTKEGSFGVRVNDLIREQGGKGKIENAEGNVGEKNCWGRISAWCDYSGPIDDKTVGIAVLADPKNPYPSCWHARGYGLMAANPFGRARSGFPAMKGKTDLVKLAKGEHLKLRYGLLIHPGDAKGGKVADYYKRFVKLAEKEAAHDG
ncbi:MAG TPA: PmoA family protein, partial [Gemmataceae bacterium]|nr:PmoA family protein [Gemmataceae bacterium]